MSIQVGKICTLQARAYYRNPRIAASTTIPASFMELPCTRTKKVAARLFTSAH